MCLSENNILKEFRKDVFLQLMKPENLEKYSHNYQQLFPGMELVKFNDKKYLMVSRYCDIKFAPRFIRLWKFYFKSFGLRLLYKKINNYYRVGFEMETFCKKSLKINKNSISLKYPKFTPTPNIKKEAEIWTTNQKEPWQYITMRQGILHLVSSFIRDVNFEISEMKGTDR